MPASGFSYNKWENLDDSDDDGEAEKAKDALLSSKKTFEMHERDDKTAKRVVQYMERFESTVPIEDRLAVAHFVAVCDKGVGEQTNIYRYSEIINVCQRCSTLLLNLEMVDKLAALHASMIRAAPSAAIESKDFSVPLVADAHLLMEAVNTLEACRRVPSIPSFYEEICTPSQSDKAKELTRMYMLLEFGQRAMMRHLFNRERGAATEGNAASTQAFEQVMREEEAKFEEKMRGGAVPVGSSAKPPPMDDSEDPGLWSQEGAILMLGFAFLIGMISLGFYFWYTLDGPMNPFTILTKSFNKPIAKLPDEL